MMKQIVILIVAQLIVVASLFAQVPNDECETAIILASNGCSGATEYNITNATASSYSAANCMTNVSHDMWFQFIATAPDLTITINGTSSLNPEVVLYGGNCGGTINELECGTDANNTNTIEIYQGGLTVGETYLIRVDGRNNSTGAFQICLNNYTLPAVPGADCSSRSFLCDKSPFVVQSVVGSGNNTNEVTGTCLNGGSGGGETNSTWFAWTCGTAGTLTFTLSPTNPNDDLDFIVYELPNGVNDCSGKTVLRCMASGDNNPSSPCMGDTGLSETATDTEEQPGCGNGQDGWVAPLNMEVGKSYALIVNNFSATGNGFSITFGGTGEFQGSEPHFNTDDANNKICMGNSITYTDASTSAVGSIVGRAWNFGLGATPATASGPGPHTVSYNSLGTKSVVLTVENSLGCIVSEIKDIIVEPCCETDNAMTITGTTNELECYDNPNGEVNISVNSPFPITGYTWSNGATTQDINGLTGGNYTVTVTNQFCTDSSTFEVASPPPFDIDTVMTMATCNGGQDGTLTLNVSGATPPFSFQWYNSSDFVLNDNTRTGLAIGNYAVTIQDANNCQKQLNLEVTELTLELNPNVDAVIPPSCYGYNDGRITLLIHNGLPPYQYNWNDGNGYANQSTLNQVAAGSYTINVLDANGCEGVFHFDIGQPEVLGVTLDSVNVSCYGEADGQVIPSVLGGTKPYSYAWSNGMTDSLATGLVAGNYSLTVTDASGCQTSANIPVQQPDELYITGINTTDVVCYGDSTGTLTVHAGGGNPPYRYSVWTDTFQLDSVITNLAAGTYQVTVSDSLGCAATQSAFIYQPPELVLNAGNDTTVALGFEVQLQATLTPPVVVDWTWTPSDNLTCEDCPNPAASPVQSTVYTIQVKDEDGCTDVDSILVSVNKLRPIFIPNIFTPNNDGKNDWFSAYGGPAASKIVSLEVFDRWGGLVYRAKDLPMGNEDAKSGWNGMQEGKPAHAGVYVYVFQILFKDGVTVQFSGDITLLEFEE